MTDYSSQAVADRLKQVSEARRLGLTLREAGKQLDDGSLRENGFDSARAPDIRPESRDNSIPVKR